MSNVLTFIEDLPKELAEDVTSIFNKAEAAYKKLSPEVQAALKNGSGILATINADLTGPYATVLAAITAKFGINEADVISVMAGLAKAFNIAIADTSSGTALLTALQGYLGGLGGYWADICNAGASIAATILNGGNEITIAMNVVKYVYLDLVKPLFSAG